jgi:hypothetical protein
MTQFIRSELARMRRRSVSILRRLHRHCGQFSARISRDHEIRAAARVFSSWRFVAPGPPRGSGAFQAFGVRSMRSPKSIASPSRETERSGEGNHAE